MVIELKPLKTLNDYDLTKYKVIFLAGTIENNSAKKWQQQVVNTLNELLPNENIIILNPRRDNWVGSTEQTVENVELNKQINWELDGLEISDIIYLHFEKDTKSPISLLELGLFSDKNVIVNCPDGFYRKANVDIVCNRYKIENYENYEESVYALIQKIKSYVR